MGIDGRRRNLRSNDDFGDVYLQWRDGYSNGHGDFYCRYDQKFCSRRDCHGCARNYDNYAPGGYRRHGLQPGGREDRRRGHGYVFHQRGHIACRFDHEQHGHD